MSILSDKWPVNISSNSKDCHFTFLMASFIAQKFLILINSFFFLLSLVLLVSHLKNLCLTEGHKYLLLFSFKTVIIGLTSVAQLFGHHPAKWKVTGSISSQGTCLGCHLFLTGACRRGSRLKFLPHIDVSLPLFLPLFPSH